MKKFSHIYLVLVFFCVSGSSIIAQTSDKLWHKKNAFEISSVSKIERKTIPKEYEIYNLDINSLKYQLQTSEKRKVKTVKSSTIISFPSTNGEFKKYEVFEASVMDESLQKKFPNIKSYVGKSLENPSITIRFSLSNLGLHAMIMGDEKGAAYIDPYTSNKESYIIYSKNNLPSIEGFKCMVDNVVEANKAKNVASKSENANDAQLRTFRLAIATTGEYSQFQLIYNGIASSATLQEKQAAVMAAINATMTRVNGIFERDVALTMKLVANNENIIFFDPDTDGFTNDDSTKLINESQEKIDDVIGNSNYDIGHTFSTGGGGLATLKSPCRSTVKAKGITGSSFPIGDAYDIDFVAHEMGHQFGANHTFNSPEGNCGGNSNSSTSVEPGSGSTIMAYAGLCAPDNIQSNGDDYFHIVSINEMWNNISTGSSTCAVKTVIDNSPPTVEELMSYTLPVSTPFMLDATATDTDVNDVLTYTWEQLDTETAEAPPVSTSTGGPSFRSIAPTTSSRRYFPNQERVISRSFFSGWEVLPTVSRTMTFGVNVRDNNINGGQTASRETTLTFDADSGPFKLISQAVTEYWNVSETKTITWDVANTNNAPVSCSNVNILLSTDGGYTFPITLAAGVPNNGSYTITVPNVTSSKGRVKIESVDNVFYAINNANLFLQAKEFTLAFSETMASVCEPSDGVYNFTYNTSLDFSEETVFEATGLPTGASVVFSPAKATDNDTMVEMKITGTSNVEVGDYTITVAGTSAVTSMVKEELVVLKVYNSLLVIPTLVTPVNNATEIVEPYQLEWDSNTNSTAYVIQISKEENFNVIVEEATVDTNSFLPENLKVNTSYYWRVKSKNNCSESVNSTVFNFKTANVKCDTYNSTDIPKDIPDNDTAGVNSIINVSDAKTISNVIVNVNISHTYIQDLALTLVSPEGISILLSVGNGGAGANYSNTTFDDAADKSIKVGVAPFIGSFKPEIPLSYLEGIKSAGNWKLNVVDSGEADIGTINSWSIEICGVSEIIANDDDGDGVVNSIDQCPNTTAGAMVDEVGCFTLASNNFDIQTVSETCTGENNGKVIITAINTTYNYTAVINGQTYTFSGGTEISSLAPSIYELCISVDGETFEQCYSVNVESGILLAAKTTASSKTTAVEINEGTAPYVVFVNGNKLLETSETNFDVDVVHGDLLEVKSSIECEGIFSKEINLLVEITAYPNPSNGNVYISLPIKEKQVVIELYNMQSQLISSQLYAVNGNRVQLNIEREATGIYIAKIILDKPVILKIVKQ